MAININERAISDFHIHTRESDGVYEPRAILGAVFKKSKLMKHLCFTDHHTTRAFDRVEAIKEFYGVEVLPGVEISTSDYKGLHILGIGMNQRDEIEKTLAKISTSNEKQLLKIFSNLKGMDIDLGKEFIDGMINSSNISREKIAAELVKQGYAENIQKARKHFVNPCAQAGTQTTKLSAQEAISLIKSGGGVPIIAHPCKVKQHGNGKLDERQWEVLLDKLVGYGLQGIESIHMNEDTNTRRGLFPSLAKNFKLLQMGGSDFHGNGNGKGRSELGNPNMKQRHIDKLLTAVQNANELV